MSLLLAVRSYNEGRKRHDINCDINESNEDCHPDHTQYMNLDHTLHLTVYRCDIISFNKQYAVCFPYAH